MNPRLKELVRICIKRTLVEPPPFAFLPLLSAHLSKYHYKPMQQVLLLQHEVRPEMRQWLI